MKASERAAYPLRMRGMPDLDAIVAACGFVTAEDRVRPGDILLARTGHGQFHLAIALTGDSFVHAHAGLRRVVVQPGPLAWPLVGRWRLLPEDL